MITINLEDMKDAKVEQVTGDIVEIKLVSQSGAEVSIRTTQDNAAYIHEQLEAVVADEPYRYETMQAELDKAQSRIDELEELLQIRGLREAV